MTRRKRVRRRPRRGPNHAVIDTVRVEEPIAAGDVRYEFCVGDATMESLAHGICPEALAAQCHALMKWKRDGERAIARKDVDHVLKPYAVVETSARR